MKKRPWRPPTYHASSRLVSLTLLLATASRPLKRPLIVATLGISERTLFRYLLVLRAVLGDLLVETDGAIALCEGWQDVAAPARRKVRA